MIAVCCAGGVAAAEDTELVAPSWSATTPADASYDWIQLVSGEWIKGRLLSMRQNKVDFDSVKLDQLSIKWKNIREIRTAGAMSVMGPKGAITVGQLRTVDGQLVVGDSMRIAHDDVISIAKSTPKELDRWIGNVSLGVDVRDGNVDQKDITVNVGVKRRTANSTVTLNYLTNYSEFDSEENANDQRLNLSYDYRLSRDWFVRPIQGEYFRDPFQNISSRVTVGPGVGYFLINNPTLNWFVVVGPAFQHTRFTDTPTGQSESASTPVGILSSDYDQELTSYLDLLFRYQLFVTDKKSGQAAHHFKGGLDIDLTSSLDLQISAYWDRIENPQVKEDGSLPKRDDFRFVIGLDWEL